MSQTDKGKIEKVKIQYENIFALSKQEHEQKMERGKQIHKHLMERMRIRAKLFGNLEKTKK